MFEMTEHFYIGCHMLTSFFASYDEWRQECARFGRDCTLSASAYDDYLRGTDAALSIPLWASASKNRGHVLQNEVTCDVIKCYKKHGYQPVGMEGNPPDYIGEQLRFLEYLSSLTIRGIRAAESEIDDFIQSYTLDTAQAIVSAASKHDCPPEMKQILGELVSLLRTGRMKDTPVGIDFRQFDSFEWPMMPEIPVEDERYICSAGLNNCGGKCRINVMAQEGCILGLDTDMRTTETPPIRACVRGKGYKRTFLNAGRIRYPMKRAGERGSGKFTRISWEEAVDIIASEMVRTR